MVQFLDVQPVWAGSELLLEVAEDDAEAARHILQETMIEAFQTTFPGAPLAKVVEVKIGKTWKEVK